MSEPETQAKPERQCPVCLGLGYYLLRSLVGTGRNGRGGRFTEARTLCGRCGGLGTVA